MPYHAMTRRDFLSFGAVTSGVLLMAGCSAPSGIANGTAPSSSSVASSTSSATSQESTGSAENKKVDFKMLAVRSFSDDVAWVSQTKEDSISLGGGPHWSYLVDTNGNLLVSPGTVEQSFNNPSNFCNGVACVGLDSSKKDMKIENYGLMDKKGKIVWSLEDDGLSYAVDKYGKDAVTGISANTSFYNNIEYPGYLEVSIKVDTYSSTGTLSGLLNSKGQWVIEPGPLESAGDAYFWNNEKYEMCNGSHLLIFRTGEMLDSDPSSERPSGYTKYAGRTYETINNWEEYTVAHDGVRFDEESSYSGNWAFRDASRNTVLDVLALYPDADTTYSSYGALEFNDGYSLLVLENSGGGQYITAIDRDGNRMFEPIKYAEFGPLLQGAFFYNKKNNDGTGYFLTYKGERLGQVVGKDAKPFSCGRAWVKVDDEWRCIDSNGEIAF